MSTWTEHSLLVAMQTTFGTPNPTTGDFKSLACFKPQITFAQELEDFELLTGQVGADSEQFPGRRHGTITVGMPLEGFKEDFNPTAEDPGGAPVGSQEVIPPWLAMLANVLGSNLSAVTTNADFWRGLHLSVSQYTAAGVLSATAGAITCDNAAASNKVDVGQLVVTGLEPTSTSLQIGFAKTKSGQVITLFDSAKNTVNDTLGDLFGTATAYLSSEHSSCKPLTFRWLGESTEFAYILSDAVCTSIKMTWESGAIPTVEFTFNFYNRTIDKTLGGLVVPSDYLRIPQLVGTSSGNAVIDGTAKCSIESCTWEWTATLKETKCHGTGQGISGFRYIKPRIKASFSVPHDTTDTVHDAAGSAGNTGVHRWHSAFELGTRVSLGVYVGDAVGKVWAFLIPSGVVRELPQVIDRDGEVAYQLSLTSGSYSADSTDTAETSANSPLDSVARVALG